MNIFLIGFMGAGKTTVSQALRDRCGMQLMEMDEEIEFREGRKISEIFAKKGETYFRDQETALLEEIRHKQNYVVSCGGGVILRKENIEIMRDGGTVVYLSVTPETVYARLKDTHTRPLLEGHMSVEEISRMMQDRLQSYQEAADITIITDGRDVGEICEELIKKVHKSVTNLS